jgi:hypothetical protein
MRQPHLFLLPCGLYLNAASVMPQLGQEFTHCDKRSASCESEKALFSVSLEVLFNFAAGDAIARDRVGLGEAPSHGRLLRRKARPCLAGAVAA